MHGSARTLTGGKDDNECPAEAPGILAMNPWLQAHLFVGVGAIAADQLTGGALGLTGIAFGLLVGWLGGSQGV